jgi:aspartyl-tRNA(Asn)/glutamyl-tRNA(Gln) amidotransferase subunit A
VSAVPSSATALYALPASELAEGYAAGHYTPVDVLHSVLARIERWEPHLKATYALDADAALAAARASEARWWRREALGPLDGVPVTVKENIASLGTPMPLGCAATELASAVADAPPMARLREAGAVLVSKTTMPDLGMLTSGLSSFHPLTRNPWNLARNPGGSSSGAGAAGAAGYGPLHLGTDIGGSIRLPAGWCGLVGFKPSLGRIPIFPPYAGRVAGPMTRSVADAALSMTVLSKPDRRDTMSLPWQAIDWLDLQPDRYDPDGPQRLHGLRLGLQLDAGWGLPVDPEVTAAVQAAARLFEAAGAVVEPVAPFTTRAMVAGMDDFWRMRAWLDISAWPQARQDRVLPYIRRWAQGGAGLTGEAVFRGYSQMGALREAAVVAGAAFDAVLSPVCPVVACAAEFASPTNDPAAPFEHIAFTLPYNMSEQPAISVPMGLDRQGLPIGLQIAGRRHEDLAVLRLARSFERLRGTLPPWPEPPAPTAA